MPLSSQPIQARTVIAGASEPSETDVLWKDTSTDPPTLRIHSEAEGWISVTPSVTGASETIPGYSDSPITHSESLNPPSSGVSLVEYTNTIGDREPSDGIKFTYSETGDIDRMRLQYVRLRTQETQETVDAYYAGNETWPDNSTPATFSREETVAPDLYDQIQVGFAIHTFAEQSGTVNFEYNIHRAYLPPHTHPL